MSSIDAASRAAFVASDDVVVVLAASDLLTDRFSALAQRYRDRYSFGIEAGSLADLDLNEPVVRCFHGDVQSAHAMATAADLLSAVGALDGFVRQCATPVVAELTRRSEPGLLQVRGGGPFLNLFFF